MVRLKGLAMVNVTESLHQQLDSGGALTLAPQEWIHLSPLAQTHGYAYYEVNCERAKSRSGVLKAIGRALGFPDQVALQMSDLSDCLTDTLMMHPVGMVVLLRGLHCQDEPMLRDPVELLQAFHDAADYASDHQRVLTYGVEAVPGLVPS